MGVIKSDALTETGRDKLTIISLFILSALFIYGLQIKTISSLFLMAAFGVSLFMKDKKLTVNILFDTALVFLFCFIYYAIMLEHRQSVLDQKMIIIVINFCLAYYLGAILSRMYLNLNVVLIVAVSGFVLFSNLTIFNHILIAGNTINPDSIVLTNRNVPSIWGGEESERVSATGLALYLALGISLITAVYSHVNLYIKVYCVAISVLSLTAALAIQGRTPLITAIAILVLSTFLFLIRSLNTRKAVIRLSFLFAVLAILLAVYMDPLIDYIYTSPLFERQVDMGMDDVRYIAWREGLQSLVDHPFGGKMGEMTVTNFYHNLWLDIGWYGGLIPVMILLLIQLKHLPYVMRAIISDRYYIVLGLVLSFGAGMMVEPIMQGYNYYFILSFFIFAYIKYHGIEMSHRQQNHLDMTTKE